MLRKTISLLTAIIVSANIFAQKVYTSADVFTEKNAVWFGMDFTHCKFIGQPAIHGKFFKEPHFVVRSYFPEWNLYPVKEPEKYDIKGVFQKEYIYFDIDTVMERNKRYDANQLISTTFTHKISLDEITAMVSSYKGVTKEGIGIVYIVETFNHENDVASFYAVIFDIASKKILLQENITAKAHGGTLKTFWAGAFREALEKNHKIYRKWKKAAMVK